MRNILDWIKTNPITLGAVVVTLLAVGLLIAGPIMGGRSLSAKMEAATRLNRDIQQARTQSVTFPAPQPDEQPVRYDNLVITPSVIRKLDQVYGHMRNEYEKISQDVVERNRGSHDLMVSGLLPQPLTDAIRFQGRDLYQERLVQFVRDLEPGMPADMSVIQEELREIERDMLDEPSAAGRGARDTEAATPAWQPGGLPPGARRPGDPGTPPGTTPSGPTQEQLERLRRDKSARLMEMLQEHAQQIRIYAISDIRDNDFPLPLGPLAQTTGRPRPDHLWEAQLELWIKHDLIRAINLANFAGRDTIILEDGEEVATNVMNNPVKRLIRLEVLPGYIGLHNAGLAGGTPRTHGGAGGGAGTAGTQAFTGMYAPPPFRTNNVEDRMPDNFFVSPTGRVSNAIYDVRHARLVAVVDFQQLPMLFEAINRVNLMTVIHCNIEDVDEFAALAEGYVYGAGDAVQVDMTIETIWLRQWTKAFMPRVVRQYLGIDELPGAAGTSTGSDFEDFN